MRIGVDGHALVGKRQGSRTWLLNILRHLDPAAHGHEWFVYSFDIGKAAALIGEPAFHHRLLPDGSASARLIWHLPRAAILDRLDVLLTQYQIAPIAPCRQVVVIHDVLFESRPAWFPPTMRWRLRLGCRYSALRARRVITVSEYSRTEIAQRYGIAPEKIVVACNAAEPVGSPDAAARARVQALGRYLLCVGRLEPRKNIALAIRATVAARAEGVSLVIVGQCEPWAPPLPLGEAGIVHIPEADDGLLTALYEGALALIYPSFGEGFGLPVIEALRVGTPVLCSSATAMPEVGGELASYFNPCTPHAEEELAQMVASAIAQPRRLDANSVERHLARFNWRTSANAVATALTGDD